MARFEFKMPDVGEGLADVEVVKWFVQTGDTVEENQPIADVETDKAIVTMPAPASGRVIELAAQEGQRVKVGAFLLAIETGSETTNKQGDRVPTSGEHSNSNPQSPIPSPQSLTPDPQPPAILASPVARKLAQDLGIALEDVAGTGPRGRINVEDVQRHQSFDRLVGVEEALAGEHEREARRDEQRRQQREGGGAGARGPVPDVSARRRTRGTRARPARAGRCSPRG